MKPHKKKLLISYILICFFQINKPLSNIHVIGARPSGFFSNFNQVLSHLVYCDKNNLIPLVYWDDKFPYHTVQSHANSWLDFFEPISKEKHFGNEPIHRSHIAPDGYEVIEDCNENKVERIKIKKIISKYIKIVPTIKRKIEKFYESKFKEKFTIGIHLRGTDKICDNPTPILDMINTANKYVKEYLQNCDYQFFIATDEELLLTVAQAKLNGPILTYDSYRSKNGRALHYSTEIDKLKAGKDVLIETVLLSQCNLLIHNRSNVSHAALYFNPNLKNIMFKRKNDVLYIEKQLD